MPILLAAIRSLDTHGAFKPIAKLLNRSSIFPLKIHHFIRDFSRLLLNVINPYILFAMSGELRMAIWSIFGCKKWCLELKFFRNMKEINEKWWNKKFIYFHKSIFILIYTYYFYCLSFYLLSIIMFILIKVLRYIRIILYFGIM